MVVAVLGLVGGASAVPAAADDPDRPGPQAGAAPVAPSREHVQQARARVADTARDVSAIQASLVLADQRLLAAAVRAESASEAYNGALWRLRQARAAHRAAKADAARARRSVTEQRDHIGALAARSYQEAGELGALSAVLGADGPQAVLDQYAAYAGASSAMEADYQRFEATDSLARVFEHRAERARTEQTERAALARRARARAVSAAESAQAEASAITAEKDALVRELARAQHVSVALARTRRSALEQVAQQRAAERSRRLAQARARSQARAEKQVRARQAARTARPDSPPRERSRPGSRTSAEPDADRTGASSDAGAVPSPEVPRPQPAPAPQPVPSPVPSGGGQQAVRFAEAQLGEPYQWAAAGPGSWDCSGLTMAAWASAGRSLPHYSVAQYSAGVPITVSQLQPGDLVFWSANGAPGGIHHVAIYAGGGQIIHAPRTGRPVARESMYYWVPPDLFARV